MAYYTVNKFNGKTTDQGKRVLHDVLQQKMRKKIYLLAKMSLNRRR